MRFLKSKEDKLMNDIYKKGEKVRGTSKIMQWHYDMEAFEHLQNNIIENIESVILEKDQQSILILVAVFEAYKEDPQ